MGAGARRQLSSAAAASAKGGTDGADRATGAAGAASATGTAGAVALEAADSKAAATPLSCALGDAGGNMRLRRLGPDRLVARGCRLQGGGHPA